MPVSFDEGCFVVGHGWGDLGYNIKVDASTIGYGLDYGSETYLYKDDDES
jgi:hypothetical protein